jgi:hypothetical protein
MLSLPVVLFSRTRSRRERLGQSSNDASLEGYAQESWERRFLALGLTPAETTPQGIGSLNRRRNRSWIGVRKKRSLVRLLVAFSFALNVFVALPQIATLQELSRPLDSSEPRLSERSSMSYLHSMGFFATCLATLKGVRYRPFRSVCLSQGSDTLLALGRTRRPIRVENASAFTGKHGSNQRFERER